MVSVNNVQKSKKSSRIHGDITVCNYAQQASDLGFWEDQCGAQQQVTLLAPLADCQTLESTKA